MKKLTAVAVAAIAIVGGAVGATPADAARAAAKVTGLSSHSGAVSGGQNVTVHGAHLKTTSRAEVAGKKATYHVVSDSVVRVRIPKSSRALSTFVVLSTSRGRTKTGSASRWTYVAAPSVTRLSVTAGPLAGGARITVTGRDLASARTVTFGATRARIVSASTATSVVVVVPKHGAGAVDVKVTTAYGTSRAGIRYTYAAAPSVTSLPTFVSESGGTVSLAGANLANLRGVTVDKRAAKATGSATALTITAPAHAPGSVPLTVTTAGGAVTTVLLYESKAAATVTAAPIIDTLQGRIVALSCPTTTFCMALDDANAATFDGAQWSAPVPVGAGPLDELSCSSATFCVAVGPHTTATYDGSWTHTDAVVDGPRDVACPQDGQCVVDGTSATAVLDGGAWSSVDSVPGRDDARMSCVATTFCLAVGGQTWYAFDGTQWSLPAAVATADGTEPASLTDVSCQTTDDCAAVGLHGELWHWHDGTWTYTRGTRDGFSAPRIACAPASTSCVLSDDTATVAATRFDGADATLTFQHPAYDGREHLPVSCPTADFCVAASSWGAMTYFDGGTWSSPPTAVMQPIGPITSIGCVTSTRCFAAGRFGTVVPYDGATWGRPVRVDASRLDPALVSCAASGLCATIGQSAAGGTAAVLHDGTWDATPAVLADAIAVSCGGDRCLAISKTHYTTYSATAGWTSATALPGAGASTASDATGVACGTGDCTVTFGSGYATFDGATWSKVAPVSARMSTGLVACRGDGTCVARNSGLTAERTSKGVWGQPVRTAVYAAGADRAAACGGTTCLSLYDSSLQLYAGGTWHLGQSLPATSAQARYTACGSDGGCLVADQDGDVASVTPPQ